MTERPPEIKAKPFVVYFQVNFVDEERLLEEMRAALPDIYRILSKVQTAAGGDKPDPLDLDAVEASLVAQIHGPPVPPRREERTPPRGAAVMHPDNEGGDHEGGD